MAAEKSFENKVKKYLVSIGAWHIKYFANAYTKSGVPDLLCCIGGYFVAIEVKATNGRPSLLQLDKLQKIRDAGGYGILLYPEDFDEFKNWINAEFDYNWYCENIQLQNTWENKLKNNSTNC